MNPIWSILIRKTPLSAVLMAALVGAVASSVSAAGAQFPARSSLPPDVEAELMKMAIKTPLYGGPLIQPAVTSLDDIADRVRSLFIPVPLFRNAYDDLVVLNHSYACLDSVGCTSNYVSVRYDVDNQQCDAYAYFRESEAGLSRNAALVIPGSGINQSSAIYMNNPGNYHYNIAELVNRHMDMYVYVKPNEDFLAIHYGRAKLNQEYIIRPLLNSGGSYSCRYLIDTMAIVKYLKTAYDKVVIVGLSQGGEAALYNSLQSHPDGAVIASGFSVIHDKFVDGELGQIIIPGVGDYLGIEDVYEGIQDSRTRYLFSWGKQEKGTYGAEALLGCTRDFFSPLPNVTCIAHNGGHAFPEFQVTQFLRSITWPAPEIAVAPDSLAVLFHPTMTREAKLTICNVGDAALSFSVDCGDAGHMHGNSAMAISADNWLAVKPTAGTVAPGETTHVTVTFDGRDLKDAVYTGAVVLTSNDPCRPSLSIPVGMIVKRVDVAHLEVTPKTLNLGSQGRWITAEVELPEGYHPAEVKVESVLLEGAVSADYSQGNTGNAGHDGGRGLSFRFDRSAVELLLSEGNHVPVVIAGEIADKAWFLGVDEIKVIDGPSASSPVGTARQDVGVPSAFALYQSVPNPTNGSVAVAFDIPRSCHVTLRLFDASGRLVRTLADRQMDPGRHVVSWDVEDGLGPQIPPGVYIYDIAAGEFKAAKKLVVTR